MGLWSFDSALKLCRYSLRTEGLSLIETVFGIFFIALLGIALGYSQILSLQTTSKSNNVSAASQLALEKLEEFAAQDPEALSSADNETESDVEHGSMSFTRTSTITIESDRSRTATVTVTSNN